MFLFRYYCRIEVLKLLKIDIDNIIDKFYKALERITKPKMV